MPLCKSKIFELLKSSSAFSSGETSSREPNRSEKLLANRIIGLIESAHQSLTLECEEEEELYPLEPQEGEVYEVFEPYECGVNEVFDLDYMQKVVDAKNRGMSFKVIKHNWPRVKWPAYIARFEKYLENCGTARTKYHQVTRYTFQKFHDSRDNLVTVHDRDLRRWALTKAREVGLDFFKASEKWIRIFKIRNGIGSRKITKFTTSRQERMSEEIENEGVAFHLEFRESVLPNFSPAQIFNIDQSGFNLEHHGARTLSLRGEKDTLALAQQLNSLTHSYTIMPVLTCEGKLLDPMLICLQERNGEFGVNVRQSMQKPPNLYITCSRLGKLSTAIMKNFSSDVLYQMIDRKACLVLDSWSGQKDRSIFEFTGKELEVRFFPKGSTSFMQPLDINCFHQWKDFVKRFTERVIMENVPVKLHTRDSILIMHSLILNQFQSPAFQPMFLWAWRRGGFPVQIDSFLSLADISFKFDEVICSSTSCENESFIRCSYPDCRKILCLKCFYADRHFH
ncbi:uncharacterized protein LOC141854180 [Brevipalpus obovatus]|uniref:uncharacterized protein LOC141854180 n=1 Tax=Brevipalpus obovatus TaxID=246614 RepID=UPI003D9DBA43